MTHKVVGAVVEYNPFHNGHLYHIQEAKRRVDTDLSICVMSGHFLQRGEPALVDKWTRAAMAVSAGVDLILEIPYVYAGQSAETFAFGAVALLAATGVVTHLAFGSETTDLELLNPLVEVLAHEPQEYRDLLKIYLHQGLAFPSARQKALVRYLEDTSTPKDEKMVRRLEELLSRPNTILGIEYLKTLKRTDSPIVPVLIQRTGADYHDATLDGRGIASATAIRLNLQKAWQQPLTSDQRNQALAQLADYVPSDTLQMLSQSIAMGRGPVFSDHLSHLLQYALRTSSAERLAGIADIREGLEHRILSMTQHAYTWEAILERLKSKRFPRTTLQRILVQILLGYTNDDAVMAHRFGPAYLRVLAFSEKGQNLLRVMKDTVFLPVIHRPAVFQRELWQARSEEHARAALRMLELDCLATDVYVLAFSDPAQRQSGQEYTTQYTNLPLNQEEHI
jgi:predicted nucleotidyltransferase